MLDYFVVNAFTERPFAGNPAGVCVLTEQLEAAQMQRIAAENRLPETAFLLGADGHYSLRWFTPLDEIDLCGHGTLAAAFVVMNHLEPGRTHVAFETASGLLTVERQGARFEMRLPRREPRPVAWTPALAEALQLAQVVGAYEARDLFVVLENERAVRDYQPDYEKLRTLSSWLGIVLTAQGTEVDIVSRYFCPELGKEDPVTGSSHCVLTPLWAKWLRKGTLSARQLSLRGGLLYCTLEEQAVRVSGSAVLYLQGKIMV